MLEFKSKAEECLNIKKSREALQFFCASSANFSGNVYQTHHEVSILLFEILLSQTKIDFTLLSVNGIF